MAFLAQFFAIASSVARTTRVQAMETLGLIKAARNVQTRLRHLELSIDDRRWIPKPRIESCPSGESPTEKQTGELETTPGRSGNAMRALKKR